MRDAFVSSQLSLDVHRHCQFTNMKWKGFLSKASCNFVVQDTVGTPPGSGGLPKLSYMVREDAIGGVPTAGGCPPLGETTVPFEVS